MSHRATRSAQRQKAATVLTNEYCDVATDAVNRQPGPFNGGSRVLVDGLLGFGQIRSGIAVALSLGTACGSVSLLGSGASAAASIVVLTAVVASIGYTALPLRLSWRTWGELDVALTHSIVVVLWGYLLQGGAFAAQTFGDIQRWTLLHALCLIWLLYAPGAARRGIQTPIVCALAFIFWFVAAPLWHFANAGRF